MDSEQLLSLQAKRKKKPTDEGLKTEKDSMKSNFKRRFNEVFKSLQGGRIKRIKKPPKQCDGGKAI